MADAGTGGDAGHRGIADAGVNQPRAATGNQQVNITVCSHESRGAVPAGVLHQIHGGLRDAHGFQARSQRLHNGVCAAESLLAAPEDADVAAF